MKVAIIKYNAGNTRSVTFALNRLGIEPILTNQYEEVKKADKVIFPGVGEASSTMRHLKDFGMDSWIPDLKQPVLGICLGMQLMCAYSEENKTTCLGIFDSKVKKFIPEHGEKVPHMGWNTLTNIKTGLLEDLPDNHAYFVHSYYVPITEFTIAESNYTTPFSAAIQQENFYAVQFHPEKSAGQGQKILQNFLSL